MRPIVVAGAGLAVVAAAVAVGLLVLSEGGGKGEDAPLVPTQAVVGASTGVTATATPRPEALRELPPAVWTEIEPEDTQGAMQVTYYLLDVETGRLYSPTEHVLKADQPIQVYVSWADNGLVQVGLRGFGGFLEGKSANYLGEPLGLMRAYSGGLISSAGTLAYEEGDQIILFDLESEERIAELPRPDGYLGGWSGDGRYLSSHVSPNRLATERPAIRILDSLTGEIVDEVAGAQLTWSNTSHRFLYEAVDPGDPEGQVSELRVRDPDSGREQTVPDSLSGGLWSPDDRYIVVSPDSLSSEGEENKFTFRVYDLSEERYVFTVRGAWAGNWLSDDTLGFTGNVCDTYDFYTIAANGTELVKRIEPARPYVIEHPSRKGDRIAFSLTDDSGSVRTVIYDLEDGSTREYATGQARLPFYPGQGSTLWSPDDRYLTLHVPPGKGGPCEFDPPQRLEVEVH
jgi:hypothetical protein